MRILIKNGHLCDPASDRDGLYNLVVDNGVISEISMLTRVNNDDRTGINESMGYDEVIDATGMYIMPGFIDLHVHLREPGFEYKETIKTGAMAAARGGFTSICPMPNTNPAIDSPEMIKLIKDKAATDAIVHVLPVGAVTKGQAGEEMADICGMVKAGAVAISEDGKSVMNSALYKEAMIEASKAGIPVLAHCEDKTLVGNGALNQGAKSEELNIPGISNAVEDIIVARDILLAKETGAKLHLCHCSTKDSVYMVATAKKNGVDVSAEVCPHHFTLTDADICEDDANYKMNPPLRTYDDVSKLIEGLGMDVMDAIATDHAPHSEEEKKKSIAQAPFGIVGLETAWALTYTELVEKGHLTINQAVEKLSVNPARILGIDKGCIDVGKVADLVIVDNKTPYIINPQEFASMGKNTPFSGREVKGKVMVTIVDGEIVYRA